MKSEIKNTQYYKFCAYGFLRSLRFFDAFLILFLLEKGISFTQIGILYAIREMTINIFEIPSGLVSDTYGKKTSLSFALMLYIVSFFTFFYASGFIILVLAFFAFGIGEAFRSGTHKGMIMQYLKLNYWQDYKVEYYGHTRSWSQLGAAISSLAAGVIVFYEGNFQSIFLYSSIPYFINLILILSYPNEINKFDSKKKNKSGIIESIKALYISVKNPKVLSLINSTALHTAYIKAIKDYIQPLMINIAILIPIISNFNSEKRNGLIVGGLYFIIFIMTSIASKNSSKLTFLGNKKAIRISLLGGFFSGVLCGIFYLEGWWVISIILFSAIYIIENLRKPMLTGMVADSVPNEILVSVLSAQSLFKTIFTSLIAIGLGILADQFGIGIGLVSISSILVIYSFIPIILNRK